MTAELDLTAYLRDKGVDYHRATGQEVTAHCFFCADGDPKGKGKLYLNTESWLYECKRCAERGNRTTLLQHFGDEDEVKHAAGADPMLLRRLLTEVTEMAHEFLLRNEKKLQYLLDRGIDGEIIQQAKLGYVPRNVGISEMIPSYESLMGKTDLVKAGILRVGGQEFFNDCITIPYFSHGTVVQVRAKFIDGKYLTTAGDNVRLYNENALWDADRVLVTEGELDSLAVRTQIARSGDRDLETLAVVGLAGANSWPEGLIKNLESVRRVFVGLDPDEVGVKAADKMVAELGSRARKVDLPKGEPKCDWTDYFLPKTVKNWGGGHDWRDLRSLLVEADLAGKQLFNIRDLSTKWDRRRTEAPGLQLGWTAFDSVIRPGLRAGQVMIPLAKSGTGKTVFLSNIAHNLRTKNVLFLSLELTAAEVYEHMRRIHRFFHPEADQDQLFDDLARFRVVERNRIGPGDIPDFIAEFREDVGVKPDLVMVDYLQYFARGFRGSTPYERVGDAIMETKAIGKEEDCAFIIPSQVNRGAEHGKPINTDDARDSGVVEETGDFVVSLFRPDQVVDKANNDGQMLLQTGAFNMQLLKSRHGGKGRLTNLKLSNMSLALVDPRFDMKNSIRVDQENQLVREGMHYDDYRKRLDDAVAQRALI